MKGILGDFVLEDAEKELEEQHQRGEFMNIHELVLSMNIHVLERQKLVTMLEREFGQIWGGGADKSPEEAALRLLRAQAVTIAELQEDLKSAEEEAARFSKQCRLVSARNTELLTEAKEANAASFRTATRNAELLAEVKALLEQLERPLRVPQGDDT